jgi:hypothetical protein
MFHRSHTVFEQEVTLYEFTLGHLKVIAADLDEAAMTVAPFEGANPPVWILGHLAICTDFAAQMLGLKPECPEPWHKQFAPGSQPSALQPPLPTKDELLSAIENGCRRVAAAAPSASSDVMAQEHPVQILKGTPIKTNGDLLAHLMSTHQAFHLAQLSACRRNAGKGPIV